jgi:hypothetical protein
VVTVSAGFRASVLAAAALGLGVAAAPPAAPAQDAPPAAGSPPSAHFRGKVVSMKGRRIELSYDFSDPVQAGDFAAATPFVAPPSSGGWRIESGALRGEGSCAFRLKAVFEGEVRVEATISSERARDYGVVVMSEDSPTLTLFALADRFFSLKDNRNPLQHQITTFLPPGAVGGADTAFRYVHTTWEPAVGPESIKIDVRKKGPRNDFTFATAGKLGGEDKEAVVGPRLGAAFYCIDSRAVVDDVRISGVLCPKWLKQVGIAFDDKTPTEDPSPAPSNGGAAGKAPAADGSALARKVADRSLPRDEREAAAKALIETKDRKQMRPLITVMYEEDDKVGRELAALAFKGLGGKETGFRHDASPEARLKAMVRVWNVWLDVRDQMEKDEKKKP